MAKDDNKTAATKVVTPEEQLSAYLKANKEDHYDFDIGSDYVVSSGSLKLDIEMGGGMRAGISRSSGVTEGGKTSNTLAFMKNFLDTVPRGRGLYIKAEGRLGKEISNRSGVKLIEQAEDWKDGTCYVFKTNVFETAITLVRQLIKNNPNDNKYFVVFDSMDALVPKNDIDKGFDEANKVAGGALLSSDFLRKMALAFSSKGHIGVIISQVRSTVKINPYEKGDPKVTNGSGGNAQLHYSDWIMEFQVRYQDDFIWEGEKGKSKRLGHNCKIIFRKSPNEKTGKEVSYPIKYGRTEGGSVWVEYEIKDLLLSFEMLTRKSAQSSFEVEATLVKELGVKAEEEVEKYVKSLKKKDGEKLTKDEVKKADEIREAWTMPETLRSEARIVEFLESKPLVTKYLFDKFKKTLAAVN